MSRLTVVIPTYNRPDYLGECLATVEAQTFGDFGVVVLDNASSADYSAVLDRFGHLGIQYIRNSENIGAYGNHEKAVDLALRSEFALVFHDDDLMHPRMLELEVSALERNPSLVWVATESQPFTQGEAIPYSVWDSAGDNLAFYHDPPSLLRDLLRRDSLNFGSVMYRSAIAAQVRPDMETFRSLADRPLVLDLAAKGPVALFKEPFVLYRQHPGQQPYNTECTDQHALALMRFYQSVLASDPTGADRRALRRHSTNFLLYAFASIEPRLRGSLRELVVAAKLEGLFAWTDLNGLGLESLARIAGATRAYERTRDAWRRLKRRSP